MTKIKVSPYLFAFAVILGRLHVLMTHIPFISGGFSFLSECMGTIFSTLICMIFLVIASKNDTIYYDKKAVSCVIFITALFGAALEISEFISFSHDRFSDKVPVSIIKFLLISVCLYAVYLGIEGITRSSVIIIFLFLIMLIVMICENFSDINMINLKGNLNFSDSFSSMADDLFSSSEIISLIYLKKYVSGGYKKSVVISLASRLIITIFVTFSVLLVLGDYSYISDYPFLDLGSMGEIKFLQRTDSLYVILWVAVTVLSVSLQIFLMSDSLKNIFPSFKYSAVLSFILIFALSYSDKIISIYKVLFIISAFIIPVFILIKERKNAKT